MAVSDITCKRILYLIVYPNICNDMFTHSDALAAGIHDYVINGVMGDIHDVNGCGRLNVNGLP